MSLWRLSLFIGGNDKSNFLKGVEMINRRIIFTSLMLAVTIVFMEKSVLAKEYNVFSTLDYFSVDGADDLFQSEANFLDKNFGGGTSQVNDDPGLGARIGLMLAVKSMESLRYGFSFGYVKGPEVTAKSFSGPALTPQNWIKTEGKTTYYRLLIEGTKDLITRKRFSFRLGVGAGISLGKLDRKNSYSGGWRIARPNHTKYDSIGFSWEVSPTLVWRFEKTTLLVGVRYTQFADIKDVDVATSAGAAKTDLEWAPISAFVGIEF